MAIVFSGKITGYQFFCGNILIEVWAYYILCCETTVNFGDCKGNSDYQSIEVYNLDREILYYIRFRFQATPPTLKIQKISYCVCRQSSLHFFQLHHVVLFRSSAWLTFWEHVFENIFTIAFKALIDKSLIPLCISLFVLKAQRSAATLHLKEATDK